MKKVKLLNLSEKEKQNALNEVRILASVHSNFVISYKEAFFDDKDSTLGIVMEYADSGDLYQKISEHKKAAMFFEESDIWRILIQLVKGLKALHDLKILHRDLKSANVFLESDGSAKLGDLNVSKVARKGLGYTQTGTPYYASPEVWKDQPYNSKSDIWSLGCVLYEMITLRPPFRAENMEGLYNKVIKGQFKRIPERFSSDLETIVRLLIQVNPESRPTCDDILKHEVIQKRIEYFKAYANDDATEDQALLQTIRIPKNLLFLSDKLPRPNYDRQTGTKNIKNYRSFSNKLEIDAKKPNGTQLGQIKILEKKPDEKRGPEDKKAPEEKRGPEEKKVDGLHSRNQNSERELQNKENQNSMNTPLVREVSPKGRIMMKNEEKYRRERGYLPRLEPVGSSRINNLNQILERGIRVYRSENQKVPPKKPPYYNHQSKINDLYKIYGPSLKNPSLRPQGLNDYHNIRRNDYNMGRAKYSPNMYLRNLEKYYEGLNNRRPERKILPGRKLNPIKRLPKI